MGLTAVMQPYLFPYMPYYQLVAAVDTFVFYDDVQFIKRGYINRNQLPHGSFSVPLNDAPQETSIKERTIAVEHYHRFLGKFIRGFEQNYRNAPYFAAARQLIDSVFSPTETSISEMAQRSITEVARYLDLTTTFRRSSLLDYDRSLPTQAKMLDLLSGLGADAYLNLAGGRHLYDLERFAEKDISLHFLDSDLDFTSNHQEFYNSMLHLVATYPPEMCRQWLQKFTLDNPPQYEAALNHTPQSHSLR